MRHFHSRIFTAFVRRNEEFAIARKVVEPKMCQSFSSRRVRPYTASHLSVSKGRKVAAKVRGGEKVERDG